MRPVTGRGLWPHALAILTFPTPPEQLTGRHRRELAGTLAALARCIAAGQPMGGTVIVPIPPQKERNMASGNSEPRLLVRVVLEAVEVGTEFAPLTPASDVFSQVGHVWGKDGMSLASYTAVEAAFKDFGGVLINQAFAAIGGEPKYIAAGEKLG